MYSTQAISLCRPASAAAVQQAVIFVIFHLLCANNTFRLQPTRNVSSFSWPWQSSLLFPNQPQLRRTNPPRLRLRRLSRRPCRHRPRSHLQQRQFLPRRTLWLACLVIACWPHLQPIFKRTPSSGWLIGTGRNTTSAGSPPRGFVTSTPYPPLPFF